MMRYVKAAFIAWLILEGKTKEERIRALSALFVSRKQADIDLSFPLSI
jgi:hypothetical protein